MIVASNSDRRSTTAATADPNRVLFCWSGGKDSTLALHALRQRDDVRVTGLLTTVTEVYNRISRHGFRRSLLLEQVKALGLPLHEVRIPPQCVNPIYESRMERSEEHTSELQSHS